MLTNQATLEINVPVDKVFTFVTQCENRPKWCQGTLESRRTSSGAVGIGATFHEVFEIVLGRKGEVDYTVTEYEPDKRLAFVSTSGPLQIKDTLTFETSKGGTRITQTTDVDFRRFKLIEPVFKGMGQRMLAANLVRLRNELER